MIDHIPSVHSLTRVTFGRTYGWMSPAELGGGSPQDVSFAAPVDARRRFNPKYNMEVFRYSPNGLQPQEESRFMYQVAESVFQARVDGTTVTFREKRYHLRRRAFKYMGRFIHEDFSYRLVELEPESIQVLDELYLCSGIVLIGCDPSVHYKGWEDLADPQ